MALKPCPECEKEVSSHAEKCPHCGLPLIPEEKTSWWIPYVFYFALFLVILMAIGKLLGYKVYPGWPFI